MRAGRWILIAVVNLCLWTPLTGPAAETASDSRMVPGVALAQTLSEVTGLAISPLLGAGAYGAWKYWRTPPEQRPYLPWYARPAFWGVALVLVSLVGLKDVLGAATPAFLKKPLDLAELLENKLSALLVAGAVLPFVVLFSDAGPSHAGLTLFWPYAAAGSGAWIPWLLLPLAWLAFGVVFLVSQAIQVLIVLSPFAFVDTALKLGRLALFISVPVMALWDPWWGAVWALAIVLVCAWIAGWTFRLTHFGTLLLWDWVTAGYRRFRVSEGGNPMFLARRVQEVPVRTYGTLRRAADGGLQFEYRPWLVGPLRRVPLPPGPYGIGQALLFPELMALGEGGQRAVGWWPARCRGHELELARVYGLSEVQEVGLRRLWAWLRVALGWSSAAPAASKV